MKLRNWIVLVILINVVTIGIFITPNTVVFENRNYSIADQVELTMPAVVHIEKEGICQGSGCLISEDGIIFTAKHVTDGGGNFIITLNDGRKYETDICIEDSKYDVSFLKIKDVNDFSFCELADVNNCRVGDGVFISGSPFGSDNFNSVSLGILSSKQRDLNKRGWPEAQQYGWTVTFQTDATAEPGNSGGPVFNMDGEVIGVLVAGMDATVNYSVPVAVFKDNVDVVREMFKMLRFNIVENKPVYDYGDYYYHSWSVRCQKN